MSTVLRIFHVALAAAAVIVSMLGVQARTAARARRAATALLVTVVAQTFVGDFLYPLYLEHTKPRLQMLASGARSVADVFDVKEHLAFFTLVLAIGAFSLTRTDSKPGPLLRVMFGCAHGGIILVAALGLVVASIGAP